MLKLTTRKLPERKWVESKKNEICIVISVYFILLLLIYVFNKDNLSYLDKTIMYLTIVDQLVALYNCFINWNEHFIVYSHYLFVGLFFMSLLSKNIWILLYWLSVYIVTILNWKINNNRCLFDNLRWEIEFMGKKYRNNGSGSRYLMYVLVFLNLSRIYSVSSKKSR